MTTEDRERAKHSLVNARRSLRAAKVLVNNDCPADGISRAYYAAFHAARVLLFLKGIDVKSHKAVAISFHWEFVKTGKLSTAAGKILAKLFDTRLVGDYALSPDIDLVGARQAVEDAAAFLGEVERFYDTAKVD